VNILGVPCLHYVVLSDACHVNGFILQSREQRANGLETDERKVRQAFSYYLQVALMS